MKDRVLTDVAQKAGLDYGADVKPWLGDEAAVAVLPDTPEPDLVQFLRSTDDAKANAAIEKATSRRGSESVARVVGGFVVIVPRSHAGLLDVIARQGTDAASSLAGQDAFTRMTRQLHADRLLTGWIDGHALVQLAK